jgi:hypothetical protein
LHVILKKKRLYKCNWILKNFTSISLKNGKKNDINLISSFLLFICAYLLAFIMGNVNYVDLLCIWKLDRKIQIRHRQKMNNNGSLKVFINKSIKKKMAKLLHHDFCGACPHGFTWETTLLMGWHRISAEVKNGGWGRSNLLILLPSFACK